MENNTTLSRAEKLDKIFGTPLFAVLLAIFCNVLWGCAFPFIKMGYRLFEIDPSNTASIFCFAGVRFMLGSLLVLLGSTLLQSRMPTFPKRESLCRVLCTGPVADHDPVRLLLHRRGDAHRCVRRHPEQHPELSGRHLCPLHLRQCRSDDPSKTLGCAVGFAGVLIGTLQPRRRQRLGRLLYAVCNGGLHPVRPVEQVRHQKGGQLRGLLSEPVRGRRSTLRAGYGSRRASGQCDAAGRFWCCCIWPSSAAPAICSGPC